MKSLPDYLNWDCIAAPGVVLNKDGSLQAGYYFRGANLAHLAQEQWAYASEAANRALCKLGGGWTLWVDCVRLPVSRYIDRVACHFPSDIPRLIDDERREILTAEGVCFQSEYVLVLHYTPPLKRKGLLVNLMFSDDGDTKQSAGSAILAGFERALVEFEGYAAAALQMRRMQDDEWEDELGNRLLHSELVDYLQFCVSGELFNVNLTTRGLYLDSVCGAKPVFPGTYPKIGNQFAACVSIYGYPFPSASFPGVLQRLDALPFPLRWSTRYIVLEQPEAEVQQKRIQNKWQQKARGWKGLLFEQARENPDAAGMTSDAADALTRTQSAMEGVGYYTATVVLMDEDPAVLDVNLAVLKRAIQAAGYPHRVEDINALESLLGTFPGHPVPNVRRPPVHSTNLADLLPLAAPWQGPDFCPCPMYPPHSPPLIQAVTEGCTPINICLQSGDVGHTLVFGPIGSGKSTLLATVAMQALRYEGAQVWAFDKGRSLLPSFRATGRYYDIGNEALSFCPLSVLDTESDASWAEEWIATCFELQAQRPPVPHETDAIHQAVTLMRAGSGRSLTHFVAVVQDQTVRDAMQFYTLNGSAGSLLDAEHDGLADGRVLGFEIGELMGMGEKTLIPVLLYLFRRFAKSLNGQPAYLLLDEAWTMLGHPVWREKLREWLKELRKANVCVVMATQSLSDAVRSGLLDVLLESCPTRFYGANPAAGTDGSEDQPGPRQLYQLMGLTDAQIEMVRQATPKRQYLFTQPEGSAIVDFRHGPKALRFVGSGSKEQLARVDALFRLHGDAWPGEWLREGGLA